MTFLHLSGCVPDTTQAVDLLEGDEPPKDAKEASGTFLVETLQLKVNRYGGGPC